MSNKDQGSMMIAAGVVIVAALVMLGIQVNNLKNIAGKDQLNETIDARVANYMKHNSVGGGATMDEKSLTRKIDKGVEKYIQKMMEARQKDSGQRAKDSEAKAKNVRPVSKTRDHIYGNPDALISLIEYSDFECPFCKRFHATPKKVVEAFNGKVNWVYRHFPLGFHNPMAQKLAEVTECANELGGNDAFWKFTDYLYANSKSNGKGVSDSEISAYATKIGLDSKLLQTCIKSGKYTQRVKDDFNEGAKSGISGTPGNIILNNKTREVTVKSGAYPFEGFKAVINKMLK